MFTSVLQARCRALQVSSKNGALVVNGKKISVYAVMNAAEIPWGCALETQKLEQHRSGVSTAVD